MNSWKASYAVGLAILVAASAHARAGVVIQPIAQNRHLNIHNIPASPIMLTAPGLGPFNDSIDYLSEEIPPNYGQADQDSEILSNSIQGSLYTESRNGPVASSVFDVTFEINAAASYSLTGSMQTTALLPGEAPPEFYESAYELTLFGPSGIVHSFMLNVDHPTNPLAIDESGAMAPGMYRLFVECATQDVGNFISIGTIDFSLTVVPEPSSLMALCVVGASLLIRRRR